MSERTLMKDGLGPQAIARISAGLSQVLPEFDRAAFRQDALKGLDALELKARVQHVIQALHRHLPDFPLAAKALCALPDVWDFGDPNDPIRGFAAWPLTDYVAAYGLDTPELAFPVLEKLTPLFSAEFAIRPFLVAHPELTLAQLGRWVHSPDEHVRRLVSEGSRPLLPWGMRLPAFVNDPSPAVPLLEVLKDDDSLYVRKSVANHLNDISKHNPDITLSICQRWLSEPSASPKNIQWLIRHGTRTLVKSGHPEVFPLLGYSESPKLQWQSFSLSQPDVRVGDKLGFKLSFSSLAERQKFVLDYIVYFQKANGQLSPKVFKLKDIECKKGETVQIEKSHSFKPISTRKYYPGLHRLSVQVNGLEVQSLDFNLLEK